MLCPKCQDPDDQMQEETFDGVRIERCPICKGLFLDRGELTELIEQRQGGKADSLFFSPISDAMDAYPATCPKCHQDMPVVLLPGDVRGNQCPQCAALFLDQGEVASLQMLYR